MVQDKNNFHSGASWIGHPGHEEKIKQIIKVKKVEVDEVW